MLSSVCSRTSPVWTVPVSEEALSEAVESASDEAATDVLAGTEETVLTGAEDAAPVQADNKTVKAVETAKIRLRIKSPRKIRVRESRDVSAPAFPTRRKKKKI